MKIDGIIIELFYQIQLLWYLFLLKQIYFKHIYIVTVKK